MDQLNVQAWIGRADEQTDRFDASRARQAQTTLSSGQKTPLSEGDPLPPLWHWMAFLPDAPLQMLGRDGHPGLGGFMPPLRMGRRMWAGGALEFHRPLRVGEAISRQTTISDISEKRGGTLIFVTLQHRLFGECGLAIEERQDIVYMPMPDAYQPPEKRPVEADARQLDVHDTPETLLFRYSALTFNAHRIHYDHAYATQVEHYPGLVVHGPLQATWLMQAAVNARGAVPTQFDYRAVHPVFAGRQVSVHAATDDGGLALCTAQDGHQGMQAHAIWQETV